MAKKNKKKNGKAKPTRSPSPAPFPRPLERAAASEAPSEGGLASGGAGIRSANLEKKVTFRLDADRYEELADVAHREGFNVSLIVRHLVCRYLEDQRRRSFGSSQ